ncbi:hypothetical protein SM124_15410 [Bacillus sp. 31A1R]|uniref:DUF3592 domain-containing protein n=1 Tax=Robertmurraya mangrovi TaxID=3098077 RepID=A0ABU5J124_9BACI|nr:hypothetical protein [Bacillus sp. 31A1R]MDZ5473106.1 hypothetical protein [Bacillus sp. 31A1R]
MEIIIKKLICIFAILLFTTASSVHALSWAYPFVVWKGNVYEVLEDKIPKSKVGKSIGKVKTKANERTGNYFGDASNYYSKGTKYYEIEGTSTDQSIAVEVEVGVWQKAEFRHEAQFHVMNLFILFQPYLLVLGLVIVGFLTQKLKPLGKR